jgi:mannose/fructose/sorbose-specific phosphotransferase system IIA component
MIGVVLAAHGPLPAALLESCDMILGGQPQVATVSLMPGDSLEGLVDRLGDAAQSVDEGQGILILLDMFGATPANATMLLAQQREDLRAVTGVSLPMLLETFMARLSSDDLDGLTATAVSAGKESVRDIVTEFNQFRRDPSHR